jgi:hypothetical protein
MEEKGRGLFQSTIPTCQRGWEKRKNPATLSGKIYLRYKHSFDRTSSYCLLNRYFEKIEKIRNYTSL